MRIQPFRSCLFLSLLASLWAGAPVAADTETLAYSGEVGLRISPDSVSAIPVDEEAVSNTVCAGLSWEDWDYRGPKAKCQVLVSMGLPPGDPPGGEIGLQKLSEPLPTSCGLWDGTIDTPRIQTDSEAVLAQMPDAPGSGVFAGTFKMETILHLTHRETGRTADLPLTFDFSLVGPWIVGSPGEPPSTENPIFLGSSMEGMVRTFEDCIPVRFVRTFPDYEIMSSSCKVCLEAETMEGGSR